MSDGDQRERIALRLSNAVSTVQTNGNSKKFTFDDFSTMAAYFLVAEERITADQKALSDRALIGSVKEQVDRDLIELRNEISGTARIIELFGRIVFAVWAIVLLYMIRRVFVDHEHFLVYFLIPGALVFGYFIRKYQHSFAKFVERAGKNIRPKK